MLSYERTPETTIMDQEPARSARQLGHDLRDCLHKIGLGVQILRKLTGNTADTGDTIRMMEQQQRLATQMLEQLVELAKQQQTHHDQ
jgi:hypothetical protein